MTLKINIEDELDCISDFADDCAKLKLGGIFQKLWLSSGFSCYQCSLSTLRPAHVTPPKVKQCPIGQRHCSFLQNRTTNCPNNICGRIYDENVDCRGIRSPNWNNTDITQWTTNPWEIAKCFIYAPEYEATCSTFDTDVAELVSSFNNTGVQGHMLCANNPLFDKILKTSLTSISLTVGSTNPQFQHPFWLMNVSIIEFNIVLPIRAHYESYYGPSKNRQKRNGTVGNDGHNITITITSNNGFGKTTLTQTIVMTWCQSYLPLTENYGVEKFLQDLNLNEELIGFFREHESTIPEFRQVDELCVPTKKNYSLPLMCDYIEHLFVKNRQKGDETSGNDGNDKQRIAICELFLSDSDPYRKIFITTNPERGEISLSQNLVSFMTWFEPHFPLTSLTENFEVIKWIKRRRNKCRKCATDTITGNSKHREINEKTSNFSKDICDSSAMIRRLHYGAKSETPHELEVNEEMNIVSLRSKQPISYTLVEFTIDFYSLIKQNNMKTAWLFFIQEVENENTDTTDLKEIELSRQEVTDPIHRDPKVDGDTLVNIVAESRPAASQFVNNILTKNITVAAERKQMFFPQSALERHADVTIVIPKNSRTDILSGEHKQQMFIKYTECQVLVDATSLLWDTQLKLMFNDVHRSSQNSLCDVKSSEEQFKDLKYEVVTSMSYKKDKEADKRYSKPFELIKKLWPPPLNETGEIIRGLTYIPQPQIDIKYTREILQVSYVFEPLMKIVDQIALGKPPAPHVSMRYELLRFCTLRSYPKEDKPYLVKLAEAGFYYASDGDGVVCYCCGIRRYNWTEDDQPMKIHKRINPTCKFLIKNEEVNVRNNYNGPFSKSLMAIDSIPEPVESQEPTEDVNNDWAPERTRSPAPRSQNNESTGSSNQLGISTAIPKHSQYATKTSRLASFNGWPDTASHTPDVLAEAGFFFAGFGDCVRCFYCGIGLRHWTQDDNPWIEHARWAKNCVFVKQKKGEEFVNLVQLAVQYSQDNATEENNGGNQLSPQDIENVLLSDAAQSVLDMGYQPRIIKKAVEQIIRQNRQAKITAQFLMEKILEIEEGRNETPGSLVSPGAATSTVGATGTTEGATGSSLNESLKKSAEPEKKHKGGKPEDKKSTPIKEKNDKEKIITKANKDVSKDKASYDPSSQQDPKAIKAENEQLKEQTICKICLDQTVSIVFLPCGHLVTCADCAPAMRKCPICRALVKGTVRTYMS